MGWIGWPCSIQVQQLPRSGREPLMHWGELTIQEADVLLVCSCFSAWIY